MEVTQTAAKLGPAAKRYTTLQVEREPYLQRARRIAALTVPSLFREQGATGATSETVPWQSMGGYGVNNLAAKIIMALFPPGIPFINLKAVKEVLQGLADLDPEERGKLKAEIDKGLSAVEVEFIEGVEEDGDRWRLFDAVRHMLVGGNHGLHVQESGVLKSIPFTKYVCELDGSGNLVEAVIEDQLSWATAPEDVQAIALRNGYDLKRAGEGGNGEPLPNQQPLNIYTHIRRLPTKQYKVDQECWGEKVPRSEHTWDADALPYLFLGMVRLENEHYARSYCEDYEGDLQSLDALWQVLIEGAAANAQTKTLVKPGGVTNKDAYAKAPNGAVLTGDVEDVAVVRADKQADMAVADQRADKIEARLAKVFLLYSSIQRMGERVTAEEIKTLRADLEAAMGGVYSNQVTTFQAPYARLKMTALQRKGRVTRLPKGSTKMTILTGDAGLGRLQKSQTLDEFLATAAQVFGDAKIIAPYVSVGTYLARGAANRSIDPDGLIKTDEDVAQEQQQQMVAQTGMQVAPEVVKQTGEYIQNQQQADLDAAAQQQPPQESAPAAA